jgi:hypothetical protein
MSRRSESRPDFREHNLNDADLQKMTSDALFYVLVADQKKSLIKRPDLLKTCDLAKKPKAVQVELVPAENYNFFVAQKKITVIW